MSYQPDIRRPLRRRGDSTYPLDDIKVHETFMNILDEVYLDLRSLGGYPITYPANPYTGQVDLDFHYSHLTFNELTKWLMNKLHLYLNQDRKQEYLLSQIESVLSQVSYDLTLIKQYDKQRSIEIREPVRKATLENSYQFLEEYVQLWIKAIMSIKETSRYINNIDVGNDSFMLSSGTWSCKVLSWHVEKEGHGVRFILEWQTKQDEIVYNGYRITVKYYPNKPYVLDYDPSFKKDPIVDIKEEYYRRKDGDYQYYHVERNNDQLSLTPKGR